MAAFALSLWLMAYHPGDRVALLVPGLPEHVVTLRGELVSKCDGEYSIAQSGSRRVGGAYELLFGLPAGASACEYELTHVEYQIDEDDTDTPNILGLTPPVVIEVR